MRRTSLFVIIAFTSCFLLASGCYEPGGPVPEEKSAPAERAWTMEDVDAAVVMTMERIYSPAPRDNGTPPEECDYLHYLRFRPRAGASDPTLADAVLVLSPGGQGGANSLEYISRQLVYVALTRYGKRIEVWVVDRRPNNLEDLTGLNAAEEARDVRLALDYYFDGKPLDGRSFAGFLRDEDVPYLSEFGLRLAVEDMYTLITTMIPDPEVRRRKVFVGGHSLGGPIAAFFAGWDFDGNPATVEDAGYMNCAGLVGLDTRLEPSVPDQGVNITTFIGLPELTDEGTYHQVVDKIRRGELARILPVPGNYPEFMALLEMIAMEAAFHPQEESVILDRLPFVPNLDNTFKLLHSRTIDQYFVHIPSIRDFRYTNEALLGIMVDDNFQLINMFQVSCGFLTGGAVVPRDFPLPQDLAKLPWIQALLGSYLGLRGLFIANDAGPDCCHLGQGPLYRWANFDEIGNDADPAFQDTAGEVTYTTAEEEVSDIRDVARFLYYGPTNAVEWYFTLRLMLDIEAGVKEFAPLCGLPYLHREAARFLPRIEFSAQNGPFPYQPENGKLIPGYNHLDVCTAAADRPSRRANEVIDPILVFVGETVEKGF